MIELDVQLQKVLKSYKTQQLPDYARNCIVNIPDHIKYLHGLKEMSVISSPVSSAKKTVLFILDGFGYKQWNEHQRDHTVLKKFADRGMVQLVTSMFPSSTAPSITGLSTGLTTQQHGLLEWWMYDEASDSIVTTLPFMPLGGKTRDSLVGHIKPRTLLSSATLFQDLGAGNITSYSLVSEEYAFSTYSSLAYAGSEVITHHDCSELFINLAAVLAKDQSMHVNVYWDKIDSAGHTYGPNSIEYAEQVANFFDLFEQFLESSDLGAEADEVSLQIAADHGQIMVEPEKTVWLNELPGFSDKLDKSKHGRSVLPWGLQRDVYVKVRDDMLEEAITDLQKFLGDKALVVRSQDALAWGLFGHGTPHSDFASRIGNILIIPTADNTIWYKHYDAESFRFKGMHGGLSPDEVQIAFAQCSLSDLLAP